MMLRLVRGFLFRMDGRYSGLAPGRIAANTSALYWMNRIELPSLTFSFAESILRTEVEKIKTFRTKKLVPYSIKITVIWNISQHIAV